MSYKAEQLLVLSTNFEKLAANSLEKEAVKKDKKKLDPKAEVRNRGTVCVPASSAKDKKDHFPINDEGQARNALARVQQYSSAPSWYSGSLKGLQDLVSRKVHSKYPSIGKDSKKKKSSAYYDTFLSKYGQTWWERNNPLNTQHGPFSRERNQGLFGKPPAPTEAAPPPPVDDTSTPPYAFPKEMNAPAEREQDMIGPPVAPASPKAKAYSVAPEVMSFQNYLVQQGKGDLLGPAGADGKLGPKTISALQQFYPGLSPQAALTSFMQAAQSGVFAPPKAALPPLPAPAPAPAAAPKPVMPNQAYDPLATPTPKAPAPASNQVKYPWGNPYAPATPEAPKALTPSEQRTKAYNEQRAREQAASSARLKERGFADDGQTTASFVDEFFKKLS